jgi:site-specific DNA recombinase
LPALRAERQQLETDLGGADRPPNVISLHPATIERYKGQIADLSAALAGKDGMEEEAVVAFRKLVSAVIVHETARGQPMEIEIKGRLAALIGLDVFPQGRMTATLGGSMVAGP